jgi:hypothetical protein
MRLNVVFGLQIVGSCGLPEEMASIPLEFEEPVYGSNTLTFTDFMAPGRLTFLWLSLKGIDRPFGRGVERILIRSVLVNWRLGWIFYIILKGLHHEINKKPLDAA